MVNWAWCKFSNGVKSKTWFTIAIIIVLAVLAYLAYSFRTTFVPSGAESVINQLESQGTSDEVSDINKDLNATSLEGLDSELSDIDAAL